MTVKILLENVLRHAGERFVNDDDIQALATWNGRAEGVEKERAYMPSRVLLQEFRRCPRGR